MLQDLFCTDPVLMEEDTAPVDPVVVVGTKEPDSKVSSNMGKVQNIVRDHGRVEDFSWPPPTIK